VPECRQHLLHSAGARVELGTRSAAGQAPVHSGSGVSLVHRRGGGSACAVPRTQCARLVAAAPRRRASLQAAAVHSHTTT
jgi:hypothetical protein